MANLDSTPTTKIVTAAPEAQLPGSPHPEIETRQDWPPETLYNLPHLGRAAPFRKAYGDNFLGEGAIFNNRDLITMDVFNARYFPKVAPSHPGARFFISNPDDPETTEIVPIPNGQVASAIIPTTNPDKLLVNRDDGLFFYNIGEKMWESFVNPFPDWPAVQTRGNHSVATPDGRVLVSRMGEGDYRAEHDNNAVVYSVGSDGSYFPLLTDRFIPNGTCFTDDGRMFFNDTCIETVTGGKRRIVQFDYNTEDGTVSKERTLYEFPDDLPGYPDGMDIVQYEDRTLIFVPLFNGPGVLVLDATEEKAKAIGIIEVPTGEDMEKRQITSCALEPGESRLYITSASEDGDPASRGAYLAQHPEAGTTFVIDLDQSFPGIQGGKGHTFTLANS